MYIAQLVYSCTYLDIMHIPSASYGNPWYNNYSWLVPQCSTNCEYTA